MLHHILYVASPEQAELSRQALMRMRADKSGQVGATGEALVLANPLLEHMTLSIHIISDLDAITPHLRQNPVDLLIYDERRGGTDARAAMAKIRDDVAQFAQHWGPDFIFPMSRVVTILEREQDDAMRAFELGRIHVRNLCVAPKNTAAVLRFLKGVLTHGVEREARVGMALSGGGLEGFLYQVGVLNALSQALLGRSLNKLDCYSGISSGSICATLMAGGVPTAEVIRALNGRSRVLDPLKSGVLFDFAATDIMRRVMRESVSWAGLDPSKWIAKVLTAVPTGFFKGDELKAYFKHAIEIYGRHDSFDELESELYIGATDQDSFEHVTFGRPPWTSITISEALRASCALPPFFTPAMIQGRRFIDGQVTKTVNLELVVDRGCRLIIIIDPLKPHATMVPGSVDRRGGIYAVIQTIKALVHTRFQQTLTHMTERYPDVDFLVFQPDDELSQLMAGSPMRYRIRTQIVTMAYRHTLRQLRERHHLYSAKLSRFGFELRPQDELKDLEKRPSAQNL